MKTTNYSELRGNLKHFLDSVVQDSTPLVVTRPGAKSVVVLSLEDYNSIVETEYILKDKHLVEDLKKSDEDIRKGRVIKQKDNESVEQFLERIRCSK
ncbi:MAG: type II toxin-antitoxin system Phd/YefM family antitoxin [Bacteroidales bacterium]|nr:type II toxin-antitoxin system Phd/YefM family antitoxin [Bacteroidales bacterium]